MRKTICASVLVCVLCVTTFAGDILNPPAPVTLQNSPNATLLPSDQPADDCSWGETSDPSADSKLTAALTLLDTVLALL